MKKVLLFSSIRKPEAITKLAIDSWLALNNENLFIDFLFQDDNTDKLSTNFITNLVDENERVQKANFKIDVEDNFKGQHIWDHQQVDRITQIKNQAIDYAREQEYDYLFLVDADLVLNPNTLKHLISTKKDFVFEVFWTHFFSEAYHIPNAWDYHNWRYEDETTILKLVEKGTFKIGAGGACTLLSKEIINTDLTFSRLQSLDFKGEDRHFCTRAQALGYDIFVDTHYPAYHIFLDNQVDEAENWYKNGAKRSFFDSWLTEEWKQKVIKSYYRERGFFKDVKFFMYSMYRALLRNYKKSFK